MIIENPLKKVARFHLEHPFLVLILALIITLLLGAGIFNLQLETDVLKEMPQDLPVVALFNDVRGEFGSMDAVVLIAQLDYEVTVDQAVRDIRDPKVIEMLGDLQSEIAKMSDVSKVESIASIFPEIPDNLEDAKNTLSAVPDTQTFFNKDYSSTLMFIYTPSSEDNKKVTELTNAIKSITNEVSTPSGIKIKMAGFPFLRSNLMEILHQDSIKTILIATIVILIMLIILNKSFLKGFFEFIPLIFGLVWTLGTMGWLQIPISIATVGVGAMIIGLGVDFSIFYSERYKEEREKNNTPEESLKTALISVGSAILGSSTTTITAFLALILASVPMLHHLGISLALGIFFCVFAAVFINPALIFIADVKTKKWGVNNNNKHKKTKHIIKNGFSWYGKLIARRPLIIIGVVILLCFGAYIGLTRLDISSPSMEELMPKELEVIKTTDYLKDEYGTIETGVIVVEIESQDINSNEVKDIRDPRAVNYVNLLSEATVGLNDVKDTYSVADLVKENDRIPKSLEKIKSTLKSSPLTSHFINRHYTSSLVVLRLADNIAEKEVYNDINQIINEVPKPPGIKAKATGYFAIYAELLDRILSDMETTAFYALICVLLVVFLMFRSVSLGLIVLSVVSLGSFWAFGLIGLFGIAVTPITAAAMAMIIGIGDDFGIQVVNRFKQEIKKNNYVVGMKNTMAGVAIPMGITTFSALIGFQAMSMGDLTIVNELARMVSVGVVFCMIAALTIVPALLILIEKFKIKEKKVEERIWTVEEKLMQKFKAEKEMLKKKYAFLKKEKKRF
jgi:predicted RND superfamily exporter protein